MKLSKLIQKVKHRIVRCQILFIHGGKAGVRSSFESDFSELLPADLSQIEFWEDPTGLKAASQRLEGGDRCFCITSNGKVAAYAWVSVRQELGFSFVSQSLPLSRPCVYVYDCYTAREFRGRSMYRDLISYISQRFAEYEVFIACRSHNKPSVRGIENAGFREYKRFYLINLYYFKVKFQR